MTASTAQPTKTRNPWAAPQMPGVISSVFFPSDLSLESDEALSHARLLAGAYGASLTLYHVVAGELPASSVEGSERARRLVESARHHLDGRSRETSVRTTVLVDRARTACEGLVTAIQQSQPSLVVMLTHGREGLRHMLRGSVTEDVLPHRRCPVLCVRSEHGIALPYRRILVPTDLSHGSRMAFPIAASLSRTFGAEVLVLNVVDLPPTASLSGVPDVVERKLPDEAALATFVEPELTGVPTRVMVATGAPCEQIAAIAARQKVDVIVMSTQGRDSLSDKILGSHTERVVRSAPCPVLVV